MHLVSLMDEHNATLERESTLRVKNLSAKFERRKREIHIFAGRAADAEKRATDAALEAKDLDDQLTAA